METLKYTKKKKTKNDVYRLIELGIANNYILTNVKFMHRYIHKYITGIFSRKAKIVIHCIILNAEAQEQ